MANTTRPETAGSDLGLHKPATEAVRGGTAKVGADQNGAARNSGSARDDRGVMPYQGEDAEQARQSPAGAGGAPEPRRKSVEEDALSEFAQSSEGHEKTAATSGSPRVSVGTSEARFEQESGD